MARDTHSLKELRPEQRASVSLSTARSRGLAPSKRPSPHHDEMQEPADAPRCTCCGRTSCDRGTSCSPASASWPHQSPHLDLPSPPRPPHREEGTHLASDRARVGKLGVAPARAQRVVVVGRARAAGWGGRRCLGGSGRGFAGFESVFGHACGGARARVRGRVGRARARRGGGARSGSESSSSRQVVHRSSHSRVLNVSNLRALKS